MFGLPLDRVMFRDDASGRGDMAIPDSTRWRAVRSQRHGLWNTRLTKLRNLQDEYSILNSKHFIGIHGYMLMYSVASKQSFEMVRIIRDKILNHLVRFSHSPAHTFSLPPHRH